jgi:hypothetical protein
VTEAEALLVRNLLAGVPIGDAARASALGEAEAEAAFKECMKRVAEYIFVHCVPYIPVNNVVEARRNRLAVMNVIGDIQRWDGFERDLVIEVLKGRNVIKEGCPREDAEHAWNRFLNALPHYLNPKTEIPKYRADRRAFIKANRGRVRELAEGMVSFRAPLLYKRIIHHTTDSADALIRTMGQA